MPEAVAETKTSGAVGAPQPMDPTVVLYRRPREDGAQPAGDVAALVEITREQPGLRDLLPMICELYMEGFLRKGFSDVPMSQMPVTTLAVVDTKGSPLPAYYTLETCNPANCVTRRVFTAFSLDAVAQRAKKRAVEEGLLAEGEQCDFGVVPVPGDRGPNGGAFVLPGGARVKPLACVQTPIAPLIARAEARGKVDETYPFFITRAQADEAERFSRRGEALDPPVETGCVYEGILCSDPETGELFAIVRGVIDLVDATQDQYSLSYSAATWSHVNAAVAGLRKTHPSRSADRILGIAHAHNFPTAALDALSKETYGVETKTSTTCFMSSMDTAFMRSVFAREPYAVSHVFGSNADGARVQCLYGQRDGTFLPRGYYLLPDLDLVALAGEEE